MVISHLNDYFEKNDEPILRESEKTKENSDSDNETVNKIIAVEEGKKEQSEKPFKCSNCSFSTNSVITNTFPRQAC